MAGARLSTGLLIDLSRVTCIVFLGSSRFESGVDCLAEPVHDFKVPRMSPRNKDLLRTASLVWSGIFRP